LGVLPWGRLRTYPLNLMYNYNVGKMIDIEQFSIDCSGIREQSPLIHCITNYVAMEFNANALLAVGASPIMSFCEEEMDEIVSHSSAVLINIGCLDRFQMAGMKRALKVARMLDIPWVLDPVGVGVSRFRLECCSALIDICPPAVIRGNASEILSLSGADVCEHGVDSGEGGADVLDAALRLASDVGCIVSVSGTVDHITDGLTVENIANGSPLMTRVTAMGCTASAITAAFVSVSEGRYLDAALGAMAMMGTAGERAASRCSGTGSLKELFVDELSNYEPSVMKELIREK